MTKGRALPLYCIDNPEVVRALRAHRFQTLRWTAFGIEAVLARGAGSRLLPVQAREYLSAGWTDDLHVRLPFRIGVPGKDVGTKQIHVTSAGWTGCLHDPEVVQDLACPFLGILGTIQGAELVPDRVRKLFESDLDASSI
jgi:hypothetical protein